MFEGVRYARKEFQTILHSGIQILLVIGPAAAAIQIGPGIVWDLYWVLDKVKTVCANATLVFRETAVNLNLAAPLEIVPHDCNAF